MNISLSPFAALAGVLLWSTVIGAAPAAAAGACEDTGDARRVVVELYTSEGCSSCPPADRWLSALADSGLADGTLPLALHVDYWDRIGWPDRFADARFTSRQRSIAVNNRLRTIYTPQVVVDGADTPRWYRSEEVVSTLRERLAEPAPLGIRIRAESDGDEVALTIGVDTTGVEAATARWSVVAGLTQDGLETAVERGENAGRNLRHDRVVRAWVDGLRPRDDEVAVRLPLPEDLGGRGVRAFAFVEAGVGRPVQAVDCALPDPGRG